MWDESYALEPDGGFIRLGHINNWSEFRQPHVSRRGAEKRVGAPYSLAPACCALPPSQLITKSLHGFRLISPHACRMLKNGGFIPGVTFRIETVATPLSGT